MVRDSLPKMSRNRLVVGSSSRCAAAEVAHVGEPPRTGDVAAAAAAVVAVREQWRRRI